MVYLLFFGICFGASVIGAICGIGGGVIIKPLMDALGFMDVPTISFLSGCTVLCMTAYSVAESKLSGRSNIETKTSLPLGIGGAIGGIAGKALFQYLVSISADKNSIGAVQAICLFIVTAGTLVYTLNKSKIRTYQITNIGACLSIGVLLGMMSSFLGIGGGPINLVILFFFFSMTTKIAAENSLYIILFSQLASLLQSLITNSVPEFEIGALIFMAAGGVCGGIAGRIFNKKIGENDVNRLFIALMVVIILINIYNAYKFI